MNEKFPSSEKLKSKILIDRLFSEGKTIKNFPLKLIYLPLKSPSEETHKTGVSVPKRLFRKAVERNYFKRIMREAYRKNKYLVESNLHQNFAFMFIYSSPQKFTFEQINTCLKRLLEKFNEKESTHEK